MPELPEVETVKNALKKRVLNLKIKDINIIYKNIIEFPDVETFKKNIINQVILDISRKGKWLIFELNDYCLLSHLRMEGKYNIKKINDEYDKHEHVEIIFDNNVSLRYKDTRKFGRMYLIKKEEIYNTKPLNELGLEPWDENLNVKFLKQKYKNKKLPIKTVILDQSIITGIGNIYADEILFLSNINPLKQTSKLTNKEMQKIIDNTKITLQKAIELGGTTIRSYTSEEGVHGRFQNELLVHNKENELCPVCNNKIIKIKVGGRGTYYCPKCQK
ncbi:MAG: DNA-formamidopyrimidine glycosylase [Bacilli bacterium]|nr:DNA-formamidopyrimidine glycosylase [Bacilli bacterium]